MDKNNKLLVLILSSEKDPWLKIQEEGQDLTFMPEASEKAIVLRYVGKSMRLPLQYRAIFVLKRWQHSMTRYSNYWPLSTIIKPLTHSRFADRSIRSIPCSHKDQASVKSVEVSVDGKLWGKIVTESPEEASLIGLKTILALKHVLKNYNFDYVFRTNTSSYLDVSKLLEFLESQGKKNLYGGFVGRVFRDIQFASGAGILLSRDLVERICDAEISWKHGLLDDVALAEVIAGLEGATIPLVPLGRLDISSIEATLSIDPQLIIDNFHFRCKSESAQATVDIMHHIHKVKKST